MSDSVAVLPPPSGLRVAMDPPNRGSLPPVCLPLRNPPRHSAAAPCFCPWGRPLHQASTPPHPLTARGLPSQHLANLLVKRLRLDYNAIRVAAAVPFNSVFVSAARHKNASSLDCPSLSQALNTSCSPVRRKAPSQGPQPRRGASDRP